MRQVELARVSERLIQKDTEARTSAFWNTNAYADEIHDVLRRVHAPLKLRTRCVGRVYEEEIAFLSLNLVVVFALDKWIQIFLENHAVMPLGTRTSPRVQYLH